MPGNSLAPARLRGVYCPVTPTADPKSAQPTDHALMLAVRDGEIDAMGELFERHHQRLFGFLCRLTGDHSSAEDLAQIVFQRMLRYRHTYRTDGSFAAWMYHLARSCVADHFRRAGSLPKATDPGALTLHPDDAPHAARLAAEKDDAELLKTALAQLDWADREVLLLSRFRDLPFAEVAEILGCSTGAAKVRAHRALQQLKEICHTLETPNQHGSSRR